MEPRDLEGLSRAVDRTIRSWRARRHRSRLRRRLRGCRSRRRREGAASSGSVSGPPRSRSARKACRRTCADGLATSCATCGSGGSVDACSGDLGAAHPGALKASATSDAATRPYNAVAVSIRGRRNGLVCLHQNRAFAKTLIGSDQRLPVSLTPWRFGSAKSGSAPGLPWYRSPSSTPNAIVSDTS